MINKTEEDIIGEQKILKHMIDECFKSDGFLDICMDWNIPLYQELLNDFEAGILSCDIGDIISGLKSIDLKEKISLHELIPRMIMPYGIMTTIRQNAVINKWDKQTAMDCTMAIGNLIKYIVVITLRYLLRSTSLTGATMITDAVLSNIDTWLLGDLDLRPTFVVSEIIDIQTIENLFKNAFSVIGHNKPDSELSFKYNNIIALANEVQNFINFSLGDDEFNLNKYPEGNKIKEIISTLVLDFSSVIFHKARHSGHNMNICSYCNTIHFGRITYNNKHYMQTSYCNECYIEKNLKDRITNMYWEIKGEYKHMAVSISDDTALVMSKRKVS